MSITLVVFRIDNNKQVVALFPQMTTQMGQCKTFSNGEFGSASFGIIYSNTFLASSDEYMTTQKKIRGIRV